TRMRKRLLEPGRCAAQVPLHKPEVLNPRHEIRRRSQPLMEESTSMRLGRLQHTAWRADRRREAQRLLWRSLARLSLFFNRRSAPRFSVVSERHAEKTIRSVR